MALEKRASLDAMVVARLCKEQDELTQTMERLALNMVRLVESVPRLFGSVTRLAKSTMMHSRKSTPSRLSSKGR